MFITNKTVRSFFRRRVSSYRTKPLVAYFRVPPVRNAYYRPKGETLRHECECIHGGRTGRRNRGGNVVFKT